MRWIFLALARSGWGEAVLGLRIARRLVARGDSVVFLVHPALARVFRGEPIRVEVLGSERGAAFTRRLKKLLRFHRTEAVVLSDLLMAVTALVRREAPDALALDLPVIGIDTWHLRELGGQLDTHPDELLTLAPHLASHEPSLVPVPFCRPDSENAALVLPGGSPSSTVEKRAIRSELGLPNRPLVAIATAGWQHRDYNNQVVASFQRWLPSRLAEALSQIDADVVHVGPKDLPLGRVTVHERRQLSAPNFERLIASCDLLLSTNVSATTNATAAVRGVPVVCAVHTGPPTRELPWPFQAWPVGWHRALGTLLAGNPWSAVLNRTEITHPGALETAVLGALPGGKSRDEILGGSADALSVLRAVPPPEGVLDRHK